MDKGRGSRSSKNRSGSCSSRVDANVVTYDADVDQVDIDDAIIVSDDDDNAGIYRIANDYSSEDDDPFADEEKDKSNLSAFRTRRTEQNNVGSAEGFLLAREAVVRFVQDSIAHAVDRQKRNADKNGRALALSFIEGD